MAMPKDQIGVSGDRQYRDLWVAVVLQAKDDIENEPLGSVDFTQAVAFFIGSGNWAQNRTVIGDYLDLHRDDLEKLGRRCINARRAAEGLEPLRSGQPWPVLTRTPGTAERRTWPAPLPPPRPQPPTAHTNLSASRATHAPQASSDWAA